MISCPRYVLGDLMSLHLSLFRMVAVFPENIPEKNSYEERQGLSELFLAIAVMFLKASHMLMEE